MKAENIEISSFITILKSFQAKGATTFGMNIHDEGKHIALYPNLPDSTDEDEDGEPDSDSPIKNLKV